MSSLQQVRSSSPSLYPMVPLRENGQEKITGDWSEVVLKKLNSKGNIVTDIHGLPTRFKYILQESTGDLYGYRDEGSLTPSGVAQKAFGMGVGLIVYTPLVMAANGVKILLDITSIFWKIIPQFIADFKRAGSLAALGNLSMGVFWDVPQSVVGDIWRIARSPLYAVGMLSAALFTIVSPFEGRRWLAKIELAWHEGTPYTMDIRYGKKTKDFFDQDFQKQVSEIREGKVLYLGYCMQKRGNLNQDTVLGKPKFTYYKSAT